MAPAKPSAPMRVAGGWLRRQQALNPRHISCPTRASLKGVAALLVFYLLSSLGVLAEEPIDHPFIEPKDIKTDTCLTCHPQKQEGRFVHTAVKMGCESCHHIISENNKTTITLPAAGGESCAKCHAPEKEPVLHGPYKEGQCLICHDPHSSEFKAQTRSAANSLCLECHALRPTNAGTVSISNLERISKSEFEAIPKIKLDPTLRFGHPRPSHPVAEVADPLRMGEKMSCLSCHAPHASTQENLLALPNDGEEACNACHRAINKQKDVKAKAQPR